ncbi:MAG: hypothetical protein IT448_09650 [Phycisphaerales bacterium]|nr:hypothetical protein [Phycisphaerales bacterium]
MIRIRHITDPELKQLVLEKLAERRGMTVGQIPEWFELDDADYSDILIELRAQEPQDIEPPPDPRE